MARIAGIEVETKLSLTGIVAAVMAVAAVVGGWQTLAARQQVDEQAIIELQQDHRTEMQMHEQLNDTIGRLDKTLGMLRQRMDDSRVGHPEAGNQ